MFRPAPARRMLAAAVVAGALVTGSTACGQEHGGSVPPGAAGTAAASSAPASAASTPAAPAPAASTPAAPVPAPGSASAPAAAVPGPAPDPAAIPLRPAVQEAAAVVPRPVRVQVEGTGIDLEVIPEGVEANGAMALPDNHYQAAWYRYGPAPGAEEGSSVLAAHVDSRTEKLPIARLKDVAPGTVLTVTREDGSVLRYATEGVENIAKRSLDGHRLFDRTGAPRLKLVTCGGEWLEAQDDYEDNVVLTAAPLS